MTYPDRGALPRDSDEPLVRRLFPFFFAFDRDLRLTAVGPRLEAVAPEFVRGASMPEHIAIDRPTGVRGFDAIRENDGAVFMLSMVARPQFRLRGQFVAVKGDDGGDRLLFVGGPWLTRISELSELGLTMKDFPPHDARGDFLILLQTQESSLADVRELTRRLRTQMDSRQRLEDELRQIQKMELVGRFAGGMAHNFNNILMAIHGYAALALSRMAPSDPQRNSIEQIRLATDHAAALTRSLVAMSRQQPVRIEALDLRREIGELERLAKPLLGERTTLKCEVHVDAARATADSAALKQILMNLVLNARDAMPDGGTVAIEVRLPTVAPSDSLRREDFVEIRVIDNGIGMDDETKARIFEPFFTTKEVGKGVGLGLSSVYGLIEQLGGHIAVDSAPRAGTTFRVYLPRSEGASLPGADAPVLAQGGRGERVLLVEDEPLVRKLLERVLTQAGYQVGSSLGSDAALQLAKRGRAFDLLVTDVVMPGLSGPELVAELERGGRCMPTIFMSGHNEDAQLSRGKLAPHQRFLAKPFPPMELLGVIRELLTRYPPRDMPAV
ncbi:MAG: ATP-binding protein [Planctomycetaceae bacterium]|nr:ATP-binding protein [Planctomycetaceae bacterium]